MTNRIFGMIANRAAVALLLCGSASLVTGCSSSQFLSGTDTQPMAGATISGMAHGGNQPIIGATVQLWAVGAGGYGSAASKLGSSVQTLSPGGTFTLGSYTCPSASTQTYITASGGNPGLSSNNSNIMLATALGNCGSLTPSTFIFMNEVVTAATAYALGQYFTTIFGAASTDSFGAPNTTQAQVGIVNAMATVNNLVSTTSGNAVTSQTLTNNGLTVTTAPESAKLNTIADILASCINSPGGTAGDSSNCGMLFSGVVTPTGTAPTDTLQAAVYMSLNPTSTNGNTDWPPPSGTCTSNLCALYALASSSPPYVGVSAQPIDWTVGIQYTGGTTPLNDPQNMAADSGGNIWVINHNGTTSASLTELGPTGTPQVNVSTIGGQSISAIQPRNEAIDTNGNVWLDTTSSARVLEYNAAAPASSVSLSPAGGGSPYGISIDGSNNVFYTHESSSATATVEEFLGGNLAAGSEVEYALYSPGGTNQQPEFAALDTSGNLWMTNGSSTSGLENNIFQMSGYNGSTACTVFPCVATTVGDTTLTQTYTNMNTSTGSIPALSEPFGIAAGPGGVIWTAGTTGNVVTNMTSTTAGTNYGSATTLNKPSYVAVDGTGNVWVTNNTSSPGSVAEIVGTGTNIGTVLSPASSTPPLGFSHAGIASASGIAIDPSGNVWVASSVATTGGVFEIVGAAAPTVTPIALALKNGTVGKKP